MMYISTRGKTPPVQFSQAALKGLAPDDGLYVPAQLPQLPNSFIRNLKNKSLQEIGLAVSSLFISELDEQVLDNVVSGALNFEAPLIQLDQRLHVLELFHGPTLAFKDFGARFMSRFFSALRDHFEQDLIILVATSGDTGSAVAQGFLGVEGIKVCLLYPSGKVSRVQEQQLTTAGENITALEINGTFDDCQDLVKQAFSDKLLNQKLLLSSANSINIARLIPQTFYYLYAVSQLQVDRTSVFCVPSGNFGNLTAGVLARKIGMPAAGFIAATNVNDVVPSYLQTGEFKPKPSRKTFSNAMDVGNPSNFERLEYLFNDSHVQFRKHIWGASFDDNETLEAIRTVHENYNYLMDPHTAVGYLAVEHYRNRAAGYFDESEGTPFILTSTAHPAKFENAIKSAIHKEVPMPNRLRTCLFKEKKSISMDNDFTALKNWLITTYN